jgi:hypothetical protein
MWVMEKIGHLFYYDLQIQLTIWLPFDAPLGINLGKHFCWNQRSSCLQKKCVNKSKTMHAWHDIISALI